MSVNDIEEQLCTLGKKLQKLDRKLINDSSEKNVEEYRRTLQDYEKLVIQLDKLKNTEITKEELTKEDIEKKLRETNAELQKMKETLTKAPNQKIVNEFKLTLDTFKKLTEQLNKFKTITT